MRHYYRLLSLAALSCLAATAARAQAADTVPSRTATSQNLPAERVDGIGGFFFKAKDPKALAEWYERNLGVGRTPTGKDMEPWHQEAGTTAFLSYVGPRRAEEL